MVPTASIVLIWQVLFDYNGVVNVAVQKFGGGQVDWLKSSAGLLVIILLFLWKNLGYNMILFLSAMGKYPKGYYRGGRVGRGKPLADLPAC